MIHAFEKACEKTLLYEIKLRRIGDVPAYDAAEEKPKGNWAGRLNTTWEKCKKTNGIGKNNPNGYEINGIYLKV